jgi:hypothetical protein
MLVILQQQGAEEKYETCYMCICLLAARNVIILSGGVIYIPNPLAQVFVSFL